MNRWFIEHTGFGVAGFTFILIVTGTERAVSHVSLSLVWGKEVFLCGVKRCYLEVLYRFEHELLNSLILTNCD